MSYKLIDNFIREIKGHGTTIFTGPLTPLLLTVPWSKKKHIPISLVLINKGRESVGMCDEYYYHLCAQDRFRDYYEKKVSLAELKNEYTDIADKAQYMYDRFFSENLKNASEEVIVQFTKELVDLFELLADKTVYVETLNKEMMLQVVSSEDKDSLEEIWEESTHPTFVSFEARRLGFLIDFIKADDEISEKTINKAKFIFTDYHWTKSNNEIRSELEKIKNDISSKEKEVKKTIERVSAKKLEFDVWRQALGERAKILVDYIQMMMWYRDVRKDPIAHIQALLVEVATELLIRAGIDPKYGLATNMYELTKGVEYFKKIKEELVKRADGNISIALWDSTVEIETCDFNEAVQELYSQTTKTVKADFIKGQIANKGKVTGMVRVVLDPHDDKGFLRGDILVTGMTRPEFVPLMRQAGAVVTNEGGITCHAAIVSRELNIPCIIGTKIATRVLKDGDRVEVDADNGIVRIL